MMQGNSTAPEQGMVARRRLPVDIETPDRSDIGSMVSLFDEAFKRENPRLARLMYPNYPSFEALHGVVKNMLETHLDTEDNKFMIAYDIEEGTTYPLQLLDMDNLIFGWISVNILSQGATRNDYAATDLTTYACRYMLAEEARAMGDNYIGTDDSCVRLLDYLFARSTQGQARYITNHRHLVVNALVLWPETKGVTDWEMTLKLLGWAVSFAESRDLPIWTQIPVNQLNFFRHAGFTEVGAFTLNLNDYAPRGSRDNWGTQEWVQMVYLSRRERRARSVSPRDRGARRRRPSL